MEWKKLIQINDDWIDKFFINQGMSEEAKLRIRDYSIKFSGNIYSFTGLAEYLALKIPEFVFGPKEIGDLGERKAFLQATKYFGEKDPKADGKYGELFLFLLVETVLKCPMIAYKIRTLTNYKDQVKGGDGIFLGDYEYKKGHFVSACLIGESKVMEAYSNCVDDALESLNRFYDKFTSGQFMTTEFMVAKRNIHYDAECDIDFLYNSLTPGTEEFRKKTLVHPVLLMYSTNIINGIEKNAITQSEAEEMVQKYFLKRGQEHFDLIKDKLNNWPDLQKVILDFFIIPVNSVEKFRNEVYYQIHGIQYPKE